MELNSRPVVEVSETDIYQESHTVLSDISFKIEKGEFVYLIGRTGSGKSSLLKTLYADLAFHKGAIEVAGYDLTKIKSKNIPYLRRKIGIIFQDFQLFPDRTVTENLTFVMRATGWKDRTKMKGRLAEVLMRVGLGAAAEKMPHQLSGGEQQRVVIARALINEPLILFADEPTGNLDPEVSSGIFGLFKEINRSGTSVLMATHNHKFIEDHPARVLKCDEGKLLDSAEHEFELSGHY
ncbi:ATP-binding cassette domain-containing protein [Gilvimarinus agarilyticus]|uniref:Cell division ATP-binding protein FtsE n=1 Tax=Reichenbachiella agariperforans TaxID=156994 RepID=A0A1M6KGP9_REIAG|nr:MULTISPECIES: ATP-binding cassette domain-containing protein [Reichenbachiella]MBU2886045.1 ATP-binding cassette domain-containing protein [Gilvimarinus agarilyticus]MBU2913551.1 ATP-binding cassette domain-containing protein [Reichenbachiella agariperforans]RJE74484.1 phosphonate ABC transporter ATP-binding protein [Reichenbachiella sp. MSK19-1]SHJ58124.1 cell division transport system ATP-binding protein [Reichenbachiella agariperforans]